MRCNGIAAIIDISYVDFHIIIPCSIHKFNINEANKVYCLQTLNSIFFFCHLVKNQGIFMAVYIQFLNRDLK